ncbi:hypothetical protein [Robiginitalea sp. SC105]|uniref:hypothetical protein n=1 Tax=Robiginitalea sp. SC105 TaxID=2762332 RepID=UPI0016396081|nr:hypothetical protein [Robiginitalea sp. SC105]MBC2839736.1 hypothetical protein [Robiginitalea sp. SC105]
MASNKYEEDLSEIRNLMNRSSRFLSLSGLSGILAGVYALAGAGIAAWRIRAFNETHTLADIIEYPFRDENQLVAELFLIAMGVLGLALLTALLLSRQKARKTGEKIWSASTRRLLENFFIPLLAGGLFCLALLQYGFVALIGPATLVFYGLACLNAGKYTLGDIRYLGLTCIVLGLFATQFPGYALIFWALGFGLCHILYGGIMYYKYEK